MLTRKFGFMALVLGATVLAACEKKDGDIILPPTPVPVTVTIAPKPVPNLTPGQTIQLVAVVTGSTNTAVTWSVLSGTSATVSAAGLVTASATVQGVTTIQAQSQADPNAKDVVTVTVGPASGGGAVQVTIGAVTQFGTIFPVNPGNVFGIIDITANLDVPPGTTGSVRFDIVDAAGNAVRSDICTQQFTSGSSAETAIEAVPVTVVCTFNTAQLDSAGLALLQNGTYRIRVRVLNAAGTTQLASATGQPLVFNNQDMLVLVVRTDSMSGPQTDQAGLAWRAGNVIVHARPAIFSTTQAAPLGAITSMNITLTLQNDDGADRSYWTSCANLNVPEPADCGTLVAAPGITATQVATRVGTTNLWRAVFTTTTAFTANGGGAFEANDVQPGANAITVSGNNFAGAVIANYPSAPNVVPVPINDAQPLRVDNLAPRITLFDIRGATLGCGSVACFANNNFVLGQGAANALGQTAAGPLTSTSTAAYSTFDGGVDLQTTAFAVGTSAQFTAGAGFANNVTTFGTASPALVESTSSLSCGAATNCNNPVIVRAVVTDKLANATTAFASTTGTGSTQANAQTLGFDKTPPVVTAFTMTNPGAPARTYLDGSVDKDDVDMLVTMQFLDTAGTLNAGPAGFPPGTGAVTGGTSTVIRHNAANQPNGTSLGLTALTCGPLGPVSSTCTYTIPDATSATTAGYFVNSTNVIDATVPGGNLSATIVRTYLDDETAPSVAGITAPSSIVGANPVTFTADMSDNVELGDLLAAVGYNTGYFAHTPAACTSGAISCAPRQVLAAYGLPLTSAITGASVMYSPFVYSMETTGAGVLPAGDQAIAQSINFAVRDMAGMVLRAPCPVPPTDNAAFAVDSLADGSLDGWCLQRQNNNVAANINFGTPGPVASFTTIQPTMTSWSVDSTANSTLPATSAAPTSGNVLIRATAQGPQGTFLNPFDVVQFYVLDVQNQRWIQLPGSPLVRASDADVVGVRVWRYTLTVPSTSWPVENNCFGPATAAVAGASPSTALGCVHAIQGASVVAVGVNAGRGLRTQVVALP